MNETNIRVCLIVFHFHLFVVGLWWMQEANSFGFKKCIVERQCIFCMPTSKHLDRYLSLFTISLLSPYSSMGSPFACESNAFSRQLHCFYTQNSMSLHCKNIDFAKQEMKLWDVTTKNLPTQTNVSGDQ